MSFLIKVINYMVDLIGGKITHLIQFFYLFSHRMYTLKAF